MPGVRAPAACGSYLSIWCRFHLGNIVQWRARWIRISGKHRPAPLEPKCGETLAQNEMKGLRADVRADSMVRRLSANFLRAN